MKKRYVAFAIVLGLNMLSFGILVWPSSVPRAVGKGPKQIQTQTRGKSAVTTPMPNSAPSLVSFKFAKGA